MHSSHTRHTTEDLLIAVVRDIAVFTFARPARLNALSTATRITLAEEIRAFGSGERVRGIILTGQGRTFSAGVDLREAFELTTLEAALAAVEAFHDISRAILQTDVPVIAAVNGLAVGGASEMTLCCDSRIGTTATEFFFPENTIGLTISNAASILLARLVGHVTAQRIILESRRLKADEAHALGLLDEITSQEELVEHAMQLIERWTPPGSATAMHLHLLRPGEEEIALAMARENAATEAAWHAGIFRAAIDGFQQRREQ